jgi:DNA invertase Pin-like site-specific DNA recombinase
MAMGKFTLTMFAALAELEREVIRERVQAGIDYARLHGTKSGKPIGRPRAVFRRDEARELRRAGHSWSAVARKLGASIASVRRACQDASE